MFENVLRRSKKLTGTLKLALQAIKREQNLLLSINVSKDTEIVLKNVLSGSKNPQVH